LARLHPVLVHHHVVHLATDASLKVLTHSKVPVLVYR